MAGKEKKKNIETQNWPLQRLLLGGGKENHREKKIHKNKYMYKIGPSRGSRSEDGKRVWFTALVRVSGAV